MALGEQGRTGAGVLSVVKSGQPEDEANPDQSKRSPSRRSCASSLLG